MFPLTNVDLSAGGTQAANITFIEDDKQPLKVLFFKIVHKLKKIDHA